jgi:nitroreductase
MQKETIMQLVYAVPLRHSVRTFAPKAVPDELIDKISQFAHNLVAPFEHNVRLQAFSAETGKVLYNNGLNPPNNFAFLSQTDLVSISKAGFIGELVMLHTVHLGLYACWFGHYKLSEVGKYIEGIATSGRIKESNKGYGYGRQVDVGERVICCMPVGYKDETKKRFIDFIAGKFLVNRKSTAHLLEDPKLLGDIPKDIYDVLEIAKLAPSAGNSQMWRFGFDANFKMVTVAKPTGYRHFKWEHPDVDIGMCAAHIWIGLLKKGYAPVVDVKLVGDRAFWTFKI